VIKRRALLWAAIVILAALAVAIWLLVSAGKKALYKAVTANLDQLKSIGIAYGALDVSSDAIFLRDAKALRREDNSVFAEAKTVRLSLPLKGLLKGDYSLKSLDVRISGLRIYPQYDTRGWDVERYIRELPKEKVSALQQVQVSLEDSRIVVKLDGESRKSVQQWLNGLYSRQRSDASLKLIKLLKENRINLASPFGEDLVTGLNYKVEFVPPERMEIAFTGSLSLQPSAKTYSGSVSVDAPVKGKVEFSGGSEHKIKLTADTNEFKPAELGFESSAPKLLDISEAYVKDTSLKLFYGAHGVSLSDAFFTVRGVRMFVGGPAELLLDQASIGNPDGYWGAELSIKKVGGAKPSKLSNSEGANAGAVPIVVETYPNGGFRLTAPRTDLSPFLEDVDGLSVGEASADLALISGEGLSGKLALSGIRYGKKAIPGEVIFDGKAKAQSYNGHAQWHVGSRTLASLQLSGDKRRVRADGALSLRRGDLPSSLLPWKLPSGFISADVQLSGFINPAARSFSGRTQRASLQMTTANMTSRAMFVEYSPRAFKVNAPQVEYSPKGKVTALGKTLRAPKLSATCSANGEFTSKGIRLNASAAGKAMIGRDKVRFRVAGGGPPGNWSFLTSAAGVVDGEPMAVSAKASFARGTLRLADIDLAYAATSLVGSGEYTPRTKRFELIFNAESFPLRRWLPNVPVVNMVSLSGVAHGSLDDPVLRMMLFTDKAVVKAAGREVALYRMSAQCAYSKGALEINNASASVGGEYLFAQGSLGKDRFGITVGSDSCSLPRLAAVLTPELEMNATGEGRLSTRIFGAYGDPKLVLSYEQQGGEIEGNKVGVLRLLGEASGEQITVKEARLTIAGGSIEGSGTQLLHGSGSSSWAFKAVNIPATLFSRLTPALSKLQVTGIISGEAIGEGTGDKPVIQGNFTLSEGRIVNTDIDHAELSFNTREDGINIDNFIAYNADSIVSASGFWGWRAEDTLISLEVPNLDLSLLSALAPVGMQPLSGQAGLNLVVTQDEAGKPQLAGSFQSTSADGLRAGSFAADRVSGKMTIVGRSMRIQEATLQSDGSQLTIDGAMPLPGYDGSLDLAVHAQDFSLETLRPFLKLEDATFAGKATAELQLKGTLKRPLISGFLRAEVTDMSLRGNALDGTLVVTGDFADNLMPDVLVKLYPGSSPSGAISDNYAQISGKVRLSPDARSLEFIDLTADLSSLKYVEVRGLFKGGLDGGLLIEKSGEPQPISITGNIIVRPGSTLQLPNSEKITPLVADLDVNLDFSVNVLPDTWVRYPRRMMDIALGGNLNISGTLKAPIYDGRFLTSKGSLVLLNRIVRLTEPATIIFSSEYGDFPHIFGTAAVELPGILSTTGRELPVEIVPAELPIAPMSEDLTVYFHFVDLPLDSLQNEELQDEKKLEALVIYSDPPLSREALLSYLIGGQGLEVTSTGLQTFIGSEALAFSGSRLSRFLEESLDFKRFEIKALSSDEGTPFYLHVEKELSPDFTVDYLRTFLERIDERQELSGKYYFSQRLGGKTYVELVWRKRGKQEEELVGNVGFSFRF
jgi:hypothetical protein